MDDKRFYICNICKQGEDCKVINKFLCSLGVSLDLECEDGTAAVWKVFLVQIMAWLTFQRRMMYSLNLRMLGQVIYNFQRIAS